MAHDVSGLPDWSLWGLVKHAIEDLDARGGVDVMEYGATGDGTTDDTSAIQAALDAVDGEVFFPAGTYLHTGLTVRSKARLRGAGRGVTILKLADGADSDGIQNTSTDPVDPPDTDITIQDLTLDGNRANQTVAGGFWTSPHGPVHSFTAGIRLVNVERVRIENVYAHDWTGYGAELKATTDSLVTGSWFARCGDDGFSVSDGGLGGAAYTERVLVTNCFSWDNGDPQGGSGSGFEVDDGPQWVSFVGCHSFDTEVAFEIHVHTGFVAPKYVSIVGCSGDNTDGLVLFSGPVTGGAGSEATRLTDIWVKDCAFVNGAGGINLTGTAVPAKRLIIQNVTVVNSTGLGIRLSGATESAIEGCYVNGTADHGILLQDTASDNRIVNCTVIDAGNAAATFKRGIQITSSSSDNWVQGCTTRIVNATNMQFGFRINASTCEDNIVVGNDFKGGGYSDVGTNTVNTWGATANFV